MGIQPILSLVALVGVLIIAGGGALAVMQYRQGRRWRLGLSLAATGLLIALVFGLLNQGLVVVLPQETAVVFNVLSGDLESPRRSGTHFILPVVQQATLYSILQQEYTMAGGVDNTTGGEDDAVRGRTIDGQEVWLDITVLFGIEPAATNLVHTRWRQAYRENLIRPTTRGIVRHVLSSFRAEDIYGGTPGEIETVIAQELAPRLQEEGFTLTDVLIQNITFAPEYVQAIEQAQIAGQDAARAQLQVERRRQEAEQARSVAAGVRDSTVTRAEGEAQAIVLRAQARAEALRLVSQELADNPLLAQYRYIQNLPDDLHVVLVPGNTPLVFSGEAAALGADEQGGVLSSEAAASAEGTVTPPTGD